MAALEHDYLCDLYAGGSYWLKQHLGDIPAAPEAAVIHKHFYDRLLEWKVRPSKASAMYAAVRNFGPGGRAWPKNWGLFQTRTGVSALLSLLLPLLAACGTTRGERLQFYGAAATAFGHPEIGLPVSTLGRAVVRHESARSGK